MFSSKSFVAALAPLIVGLAVSCAVARAASTPRAATSTAIEPKARAAFERTRAAYKALRSVSWTSRLVTKTVTKMGAKTSTEESVFRFARPAKFSLVTKNGADEELLFSDGKTWADVSREAKGKWFRGEMPPAELGSVALMQHEPAGSAVTPLLAGVDPFASPWGKPPRSLRMGAPTTVEGAAVDVVKAELEQLSITYFIGRKDGLLRRVVFASGSAYSQTQTFRNIKVNPVLPASTFVFTPPPGAIKAEEETLAAASLKVGAVPPPFEARDLNGKLVRLADFKGRVVLLDFWATWCSPCVVEVPHVRAVYDKYKNQGFTVIGVSFDKDRAALEKFIVQEKMPWPQLYDGKMFENAVNADYKVRAIPFSLLIGRDGKIAAVEPRALLIEPAVRRALAKK